MQSLDELYAPKAMSLDELFAAIRPPPLLPVRYEPSDSSVDPWASIASAANTPELIPQDSLRAGMQPAPFNGVNDTSGLGYPKVSHEDLAYNPTDDLLLHILARQSAAFRPLPEDSNSLSPDQWWNRTQSMSDMNGTRLAENYLMPRPATSADRQRVMEFEAERLRSIGERAEQIAPLIYKAGEIAPFPGAAEAGTVLGGATEIFGRALQSPTVDRLYGKGKAIQDEYNVLKTIEDYNRGVVIRNLWGLSHP